jgi:hypothetical protein
MWTVTADDLRVARTRASERRRAIEEEIVRRQSFWDNGLGKIREVLAHRIVISGG